MAKKRTSLTLQLDAELLTYFRMLCIERCEHPATVVMEFMKSELRKEKAKEAKSRLNRYVKRDFVRDSEVPQ
jgi:hypothetical protein